MSPATAPATTDRRDAILGAAIAVFARYGFKKTSVDDIARAAGISKQGLYLHFPSKEEVFVAGLKKYLTENHAAMERELFRERAPLFDRLVAAFDAWFGEYIETFSSVNTDIIEAGHRLSGAMMDEYKALFRVSLTRALTESAEFRRAKNVCSPKEIADVLLRLVESWKGERMPRSEFKKKIALAVRACVQIDG
ncbi:MAG TPA: TetR/AcrR family transcriptional regulator [Rhizomicrobium sp.]|jgi:AcrR family transcriptional regulator|nr:TetR/AcrR family transcriptional regulator [Rhizomicrobium sp.]